MRKIFTYLTTLAAAVMLAAPVVSYAQEEEKPDVVMSKTVTGPDADGVYDLTLETYVTGKAVHREDVTRLAEDFVLVLDTSGSMEERYNAGGMFELASRAYTYRDVDDYHHYYYKYTDGKFYKVEAVDEGARDWKCYLVFKVDGVTHYLYGTTDTAVKPAFVDDDDNVIYTGVLYTDSVTKGMAIVQAVSNFIDIVKADAIENNVEHKISIVQFNSTDLPGDNSNYLDPSNSNFLYEYTFDSSNQYCTSLVKNLTSVTNDANANVLKNAMKDLRFGQATASDYGLNIASLVLQYYGRKDSNVAKAVILFTDGEPNHGGLFEPDFSTTAANDAIKIAKSLKSSGAKVYTVGIFNSTHTDLLNYMNGVSSNYPQATAINNLGAPGDKTTYFRDASSGNLTDVFETLAVEIIEGGASVTVTKEARIVDIVTKEFTVPAWVQAEDISIKVAAYIPELDTFSSELKNPSEEGVKAVIGEMTEEGTTRISVSGYPFSDHWCGEGCGTTGEKLVITVPIVPKEDALGGADIPTNGPESGLYLPDSDEPISTFPVPTVDLPISIIIKKVGLADGESAIFNIYTSEDSYATAIATLMLTGGEKTEAKISGLAPDYTYKVQESDWSWTYNPKGASAITTAEVTVNPFIFENEKQDTDVKNAEATVINKLEKKSN